MDIGMIILIASILCFVVIAIVFYIKSAYLFFPVGKRITIDIDLCKVHTIFSCEITNDYRLISEASAAAVKAAIISWQLIETSGKVAKRKPMDDLCVVIKSITEMDKQAKKWGYRILSGFVSRLETLLVEMPLITASALVTMDLTVYKGLIVHEMLHILSDDYIGGVDDHANPVIWQDARIKAEVQDKSIQELALMTLGVMV